MIWTVFSAPTVYFHAWAKSLQDGFVLAQRGLEKDVP